MGIFLISGRLQCFLGTTELGAGTVLLKGLLRGRVGVWNGFVRCEEDDIDITFTRSRVCALRTHPRHSASSPGLCYLIAYHPPTLTKMAPSDMCNNCEMKLYSVLGYLSSRLVVLQLIKIVECICQLYLHGVPVSNRAL